MINFCMSKLYIESGLSADGNGKNKKKKKEVHIYGYVLRWSTGAPKQLCCNG